MIDVRQATQSLGGLALLKFFPSDDFARAELVKLVCEMADTNEQIDWLVKRCRNLWNAWEGPHELRAVFCSKFRPADGVEAYSQLDRFIDGIPSEKAAAPLAIAGATQKQIAGPPANRATPEELTAAQSLRDFVRDAAKAKDLNRIGQPQPKIREIPALPPNFKPITQADIDAAMERMRDRKAREEAGIVA